jgi:hypothetical protein
LEEPLRYSRVCERALAASFIAFGIGMACIPMASADVDDAGPGDPGAPGPVQVAAAPTSDDADPAAVAACGQFADALDGTSTYYGEFADAIEGSTYADPAVDSSNATGRTALRQGAAAAMDAANTAGLQPEVGDPMRSWSLDATKLLVKMGLRIPGESLNTTATEMNNDATRVQEACAAAGTHA